MGGADAGRSAIRPGRLRGVEADDADSAGAVRGGGFPHGLFVPVAGEDGGLTGGDGRGRLDGEAEAFLSGEGVVNDAGDPETERFAVVEEPSGVIARSPEPGGVDSVNSQRGADLADSGEAADFDRAARGRWVCVLAVKPGRERGARGAGAEEGFEA